MTIEPQDIHNLAMYTRGMYETYTELRMAHDLNQDALAKQKVDYLRMTAQRMLGWIRIMEERDEPNASRGRG